MNADERLRNLLFREFRVGRFRFEFLEGLLAICITGTGYLLRTPFEQGPAHWSCLLAEWYLAMASSVLIWRLTFSRKKTLGTYAILLILPTIVAEGTILRGDACVGALFFICALLFLGRKPGEGNSWLFTLVTAALLLWSVRYAGILFVCILLWKDEKLKAEQLLLLLLAGGARFLYAYHVWLQARYTLVTFCWPNAYEIVGKETVQGQLIDPAALTGLFLTLGLLVLSVRLFGQGRIRLGEPVQFFRFLLFFGLLAGYFLPYMDQSYGYLYCVLSVLYFMLAPGRFPIPVLLQIVTYAGYQERFNGVSAMPMTVFAVMQLMMIVWLGAELLADTGVMDLCGRKN